MKVKDQLGVPTTLRHSLPDKPKREHDGEGKQAQIKAYLKAHKGEVMNAEIIGKATGINPAAVNYHLKSLKKFGKVSRRHLGNNRYTMSLYEVIPGQTPPPQAEWRGHGQEARHRSGYLPQYELGVFPHTRGWTGATVRPRCVEVLRVHQGEPD